MKRIKLIIALSFLVLGLFSCKKDDYMALIGTWGVKRIDYYNIDIHNQYIEGTLETYEFTPGDKTDGIDLIFRSNRTGEMRDRSRYADSTVLTTFTYSYHSDDGILHMKTKENGNTKRHEIQILELTDNSILYENEYLDNYIEKAWLVRLKNGSTNSKGRANGKAKNAVRPVREGSLLSNQ